MAGGDNFGVVVAVVVVVASCLLTAPAVVNGHTTNISTYWDADSIGGLQDTCAMSATGVGVGGTSGVGGADSDSNIYNIVNIGFLYRFGYGTTPAIDLKPHCDVTVEGCKYIGDEIKKCHDRGIKVFISIGGPRGDYTLTSEDDAKLVAEYVWNAFLGGHDPKVDRPFGDEAVLDGADLFVANSTTQYWDVLAETLRNLSNSVSGNSEMELSATPQCSYPDKYLGAAIEGGYFDYVQVRFYHDETCEYSDGSFENMISAWHEWICNEKVKKVFVGVTADEKDEGYVDATELIGGFLAPTAVRSPKFEGVTVWYPSGDHNFGSYSRKIRQWNSLIKRPHILKYLKSAQY